VKVDLRLFRDGDVERVERKVSVDGSIDEEQRARLAEIAEKTPVTKTLKRTFEIATELIVKGT
jgi:putative redox protein